jgi:molecular chaperone DnaK (HSP70)
VIGGRQDAAYIANLNVLKLIHEPTAVALQYGIYKSVRNMFHESEPQHVMFLDLGHSSFCASVVSARGALAPATLEAFALSLHDSWTWSLHPVRLRVLCNVRVQAPPAR